MDLENLPPFVQTGLDYAFQGWDIAKVWLLRPLAWSQFGLLVVAYVAAVLVSRRLIPFLQRILTPKKTAVGYLAQALRFFLQFLPLTLPLLAFGFLAAGEQATRAIFGSGEVIAFGKRVFLFLAARTLVRDIISDGFL